MTSVVVDVPQQLVMSDFLRHHLHGARFVSGKLLACQNTSLVRLLQTKLTATPTQTEVILTFKSRGDTRDRAEKADYPQGVTVLS